MGDTDSLSVKLRKEGNNVYTSVREGLCNSIRFQRFNKAAECYRRAFQAAEEKAEMISAAKNLAMASWRLAKVEIELSMKAANTTRYYKEAFKHFSYTYLNGISCYTLDWTAKLCASINDCWQDFSCLMNDHFDLEARIDQYYLVLEAVEIDYVRGNFYLNLARFYFRNGVTAIENKNYQRGLSEMRNCSMPIHEARKYCLDKKNVGKECGILEDDVIMHECTADAMQAIAIGDNLFKQAIEQTDDVNMDMIWDVVDWYKVAVLRTRERTEKEQEAIATSRLGRLYEKVLKMKEKAKDYMMRSVQLAHSMQPRVFTSEDWFKEASAIVKKYQDEKVAEEDAEWKKQREEIKKEMTEQLEDLKKADKKGDLELLAYIYKNFPPKNPLYKDSFVMPSDPSEIDLAKKKKWYQQAVVNYHPDRANEKENGLQWKVLTEEITKIINCRYNRQKDL
ncbi:uncharacterized protein LOC132545430 [Ylistrum balloti]|uniref:uncharacterized protein LOC132545430 n=1 Tax=Ylistrum balloti TaxID=509963 RepID=UPI00290587AC|nr:uncharacterized protein LOC132545430 [Ylistrum balloti]